MEEGNGHIEEMKAALDEIDRTLHQMLLLAELSASGSSVDRDALQKGLDSMRNKIDRIAGLWDTADF